MEMLRNLMVVNTFACEADHLANVLSVFLAGAHKRIHFVEVSFNLFQD